MQTMFTLVIVVQVLSALAIVGLVLLQHGKGADMGASFGSGASGSLFGATGSSNFLSKSTGIAAIVFLRQLWLWRILVVTVRLEVFWIIWLQSKQLPHLSLLRQQVLLVSQIKYQNKLTFIWFGR